MIEKRVVVYDVRKEYDDIVGVKQHAFVTLTIDYAKNTFRVTPANTKYNTSEFKFIDNPKYANMWIAVAELIAEATQFAKEELGI